MSGKFQIVLAFFLVLFGISCGDSPVDSTGAPSPSILTAQILSDSIVYASWTQCPDQDFDAYILWRSELAGIEADPSQALAVKVFEEDPLLNTWLDSTVLAGETYWYALETRNSGSASSWSNELSLTIPLIEPENLTVFFIDPSYGSLSGDAMLIRTPNGYNYLIDGGDRRSDWSCGEDRIIPLLDSLGITHLDGVVGTHPHSDHVGGLIAVLEEIPVDKVWDCGWTGDASNTYEEFLYTIQSSGAEYIEGYRGMSLDWDPDLTVEILHPEPSPGTGNMNNSSIVIRVEFDNVSFLFTGDLETEDGEEDVLGVYSAEELRSDVLKLGHHGSSDATSNAWLDAVQPQYAAIEVGSGNSYGHPHSETLDRLDSRGIPVFRTDEDGTFVITTDGTDITVF